MALPVNIDDLITGKTVEHVRIEFKEGWNPEAVMHTTCAFANDVNGYGGGYLVIGIEARDGVPILPPKGLQQNQLDSIQTKFVEVCNRIRPSVFPQIEPKEFQTKNIIVIWVTTGEERPYKAPSSLGPKGQYNIYVRQGSTTVIASPAVETQLREMAANRKFDDRQSLTASLDDLDLRIILSYLQETRSELFNEASSLSMEELCRKMQIARGPKESIRPLNVGLLLFSRAPEEFFPGCLTNLVEFDDQAGTSYSEKTFRGPIQTQIREIMEYFEANIIKQYTKKDPQVAESKRYFNYPYQALEEVVANALYHRGYDNPTPNEIRIYKHGIDAAGADARRIETISYPGALPPVDDDALARLDVQARDYRNIRLGDFLKSLRLAEKFATGIPTVLQSLRDNGSPDPILSMDSERSVFRVVVRINPDTPESHSEPAIEDFLQLTDLQQRIVESLFNEPGTKEDLSGRFKQDVNADVTFLMNHGMLSIKAITYGLFFRKQSLVYHVTPKGVAALRWSF